MTTTPTGTFWASYHRVRRRIIPPCNMDHQLEAAQYRGHSPKFRAKKTESRITRPCGNRISLWTENRMEFAHARAHAILDARRTTYYGTRNSTKNREKLRARHAWYSSCATLHLKVILNQKFSSVTGYVSCTHRTAHRPHIYTNI